MAMICEPGECVKNPVFLYTELTSCAKLPRNARIATPWMKREAAAMGTDLVRSTLRSKLREEFPLRRATGQADQYTRN